MREKAERWRRGGGGGGRREAHVAESEREKASEREREREVQRLASFVLPCRNQKGLRAARSCGAFSGLQTKLLSELASIGGE